MKKIFYIDSSKLEKIRENPTYAWELFPSTKIDLWEIPEWDTDKENQWEIDFIPCYSSQYFCILLRINQTDMKALDRAYQHGGGFVFQLAETRAKDALSDVFTVFGTSPLEEREELKWSRFFVYYKDVDLVFTKIEDAEIIVEIDDHYTYMLAMVPWHYADPLGPFRTKEIGFNIIVPQPIEAKHPTQYYALIPGWKIMSEQELRDYVVYELEAPHAPIEDFEIEYALESRHYEKGTPGSIQFCINSSIDSNIEASIETDGRNLTNEKFNLVKGLNDLQLEFDTTIFDAGRVQLKLKLVADSSKHEFNLDILVIDSEKIAKIREKVSILSKQATDDLKIKESLTTIEWLLESLEKETASLKPHQSPWQIQNLITRLEHDMEQVEKGESLFVIGEQIRLGLKSKQDNTLQPYSMYIPPTFEEGKSGLIVMLHGSGTNDERSLKNAAPLDRFDETRMIIVAPLARGESHQYLPEESIEEIIEVTEKMIELFSIPKEKVVLGGFSMGGLGVLGSFFKKPDLYHNLMIISGSMQIHEERKLIVDYTTDESLEKLAQTNLAIFHGADDLNVMYADLKPVHDRLLELNPDIKIHIAEGFGHQQPPDWFKKMLMFFKRVGQT